jgi:Tol biopolymer transport system component
MTFGWSPEPLHAVAYVPHSGRLMLMDVLSGAKQEVPATSNVLLPAWSPDGSRIVFLQKTGRKTFALMRVNVTRR